MWHKAEFKIVQVRGSGPGGQHRNKRMTGIRLIHLPSSTVVMATERRSQAQNLSAAWERMEEKLRLLFHKDPERIPSKKPKRAEAKRLKDKIHQALAKKLRNRRGLWDER